MAINGLTLIDEKNDNNFEIWSDRAHDSSLCLQNMSFYLEQYFYKNSRFSAKLKENIKRYQKPLFTSRSVNVNRFDFS